MVKQKRASVLTALTMDNQQGSRSHMLIRTQGILFWQSQLDNIKELYYDRKMSTIQIAKIYGVNPSTITSNMKNSAYLCVKSVNLNAQMQNTKSIVAIF